MARRPSRSSLTDELLERRRRIQRFWSQTTLLAACVLLGIGLFGDRGLTATMRARRTFAQGMRELERLRRDNAALRNAAQLLRDDPATIESVARGDLGLMRRGEIVVTIKAPNRH